MTRDELLAKLRALHPEVYGRDAERAHGEADELLLEYIADAEVKAAYDAIEKWYA